MSIWLNHQIPATIMEITDQRLSRPRIIIIKLMILIVHPRMLLISMEAMDLPKRLLHKSIFIVTQREQLPMDHKLRPRLPPIRKELAMFLLQIPLSCSQTLIKWQLWPILHNNRWWKIPSSNLLRSHQRIQLKPLRWILVVVGSLNHK